MPDPLISWRYSPKGDEFQPATLVTIPEMDLRYRFYPGDIQFIIGHLDLSTDWGWVPIVDFIACLLTITRELKSGIPLTEFEFTESDAKITFRRVNDEVRVSSTYRDGIATLSLNALASAVDLAATRLREELLSNHEELRRNPHFNKLLPGKS